MSDFHIIVIFNDYYTLIVGFFDETDTDMLQTHHGCVYHYYYPSRGSSGIYTSVLGTNTSRCSVIVCP